MESNIKKVIDTEAKAEKILEEARKKAERTLEDARKKALDIESAADDDIAQAREKSLKVKGLEISKERERLIADAEKLRKAQERQAEKNRDKATEYVVSLLKNA